MKFISKLALVAAAAVVSMSASAQAVLDVSTVADLDAIETAANDELAAPGTLTANGAYAVIGQAGEGQAAYILQFDGGINFATIVQTSDAANATAAIVQGGATNNAFIGQK